MNRTTVLLYLWLATVCLMVALGRSATGTDYAYRSRHFTLIVPLWLITFSLLYSRLQQARHQHILAGILITLTLWSSAIELLNVIGYARQKMDLRWYYAEILRTGGAHLDPAVLRKSVYMDEHPTHFKHLETTNSIYRNAMQTNYPFPCFERVRSSRRFDEVFPLFEAIGPR